MFELRPLKTSDMFPMFNILNKVGFGNIKSKMSPDIVQNLVASFTEQGGDNASMNTYVGFNIIMEVASIIIEGLPKCESDIYAFLSNLSGMKTKEIAELPPAEFMEMIVEVIKKEEFKDFFKVVSKLFNQGI